MKKRCVKILRKILKAIPVLIIIAFFILINLAFGNYIAENPIEEQSGEKYLEREENVFSDIFETDQDYIEQKFIPQKDGMKSIGIRLAINHAGLPDEFRLLIQLRRQGEVLQSEEITQREIPNWRYYNFELEEELKEGEEYCLRIRQLEGQKWEDDDKYRISYVVFHAEEHVPENNTYYLYNGKKIDGEFELCYIYIYSDDRLLRCQVAADLVFILAVAALAALKRFVKYGDKTKGRIAAAMYVVLPILGFLAVESMAGNLPTMQVVSVVKNLLISCMAVVLLSFFIRKLGQLAMTFLSCCTILGLVQYFVMQFRGSAFTVQDIWAWRTAATVADRYTYQISQTMFLFLMLELYVICIYQQVKRRVFSFCIKAGMVFVLAFAIGVCGMASGGFLISTHMMDVWDLANNYRQDGVILTMASETQFLVGDKPASYSMEKIGDIIEKTVQAESKAENIVPKAENLIVIMNESFADLENISSIATDTTLLPCLHGMEENVIKGWVSVPVFGGGTANSEYEVLTGNTMAFLPGGSPYQMNVAEGEAGMASVLKGQNFYTVAAHPYMADNWNRRSVYSYMGFDTFLSEENWGELELMRWCESDEAAYSKIIELYEEQREKLFVFLVTMQNHGGYSDEYEDFQNTVELNYDEDYPEAEQYLSLLQESDKAFGNLTEYFSGVTERTMIVMFGDHLATLEEEFYEELFGKPLEELDFEEEQKRYITPFIIWANYDIEEQSDVVMSTNYLGSYILHAGGLEMSPYNQFLYKLWQEIPVICSRGIMGNDGEWYRWSEIPERYGEWIEEYKVLQYNNVYDRKNKVGKMFAVQKGNS